MSIDLSVCAPFLQRAYLAIYLSHFQEILMINKCWSIEKFMLISTCSTFNLNVHKRVHVEICFCACIHLGLPNFQSAQLLISISIEKCNASISGCSTYISRVQHQVNILISYRTRVGFCFFFHFFSGSNTNILQTTPTNAKERAKPVEIKVELSLGKFFESWMYNFLNYALCNIVKHTRRYTN